jgi:hypothetical protein
MPTLTFTRASHEPWKHDQPCHITNVAEVIVVAGSVCPWPDNGSTIRLTIFVAQSSIPGPQMVVGTCKSRLSKCSQ